MRRQERWLQTRRRRSVHHPIRQTPRPLWARWKIRILRPRQTLKHCLIRQGYPIRQLLQAHLVLQILPCPRHFPHRLRRKRMRYQRLDQCQTLRNRFPFWISRTDCRYPHLQEHSRRQHYHHHNPLRLKRLRRIHQQYHQHSQRTLRQTQLHQELQTRHPPQTAQVLMIV